MLRVPESFERILTLQKRCGEKRNPPARREKKTHDEGVKTRFDDGCSHLKGPVAEADGVTHTLLEDPAALSSLPQKWDRERQPGHSNHDLGITV